MSPYSVLWILSYGLDLPSFTQISYYNSTDFHDDASCYINFIFQNYAHIIFTYK